MAEHNIGNACYRKHVAWVPKEQPRKGRRVEEATSSLRRRPLKQGSYGTTQPRVDNPDRPISSWKIYSPKVEPNKRGWVRSPGKKNAFWITWAGCCAQRAVELYTDTVQSWYPMVFNRQRTSVRGNLSYKASYKDFFHFPIRCLISSPSPTDFPVRHPIRPVFFEFSCKKRQSFPKSYKQFLFIL